MIGHVSKFFLLILLAISSFIIAQELDTFTFTSKRRAYTVLDRIENPKEKAAFQNLLAATDPIEKKDLAESFLKQYPSSWMLAKTYEIAAKSSIEIGDYSLAILHGKKSLQLLPENPLLLVPLSNVQVQQGKLVEAKRNAQRALQILKRIERPLNFEQKRWQQLKPELQASAHFVIGRVAATLAVRHGVESTNHWHSARTSLRQSRLLNPKDLLAAYLLGIAEENLGKSNRAAREYADVANTPNIVQKQAIDSLQKIYKSQERKRSFEQYLQNVLSQPSFYGQQKNKTLQSSPEASYANSASCKGCHDAEHQAWGETGMARMFAAYKKENVFGDFEKNNTFLDSEDIPIVKMSEIDGQHFFSFLISDKKWKTYPVDYTIGSKWQQAYATQLPDGTIHVFPIQYTKLQNRWVNFWAIIDDPGSERAVVRNFPKLTDSTSYQIHCAPCHTSQLRTASGDIKAVDIHFREPGINCEMCHGPSLSHVEAMSAGKPYNKPAHEPPITFGKINHREYVAICAQCHMQSAVAKLGDSGAINYSGKEDFVKRYTNRPYVEFSEKAFYKDGRFRETTFIVESFLRTDCFERGKSHCGNCHNPHPGDAATNIRSLKFLDDPDHMCTQCHDKYTTNPETHTRHAADSEGARCSSCHMPRIMNSLLFKAATHRIDSIPNAETVARFGSAESPNACLICHTDRDTEWLRKELATWKRPNDANNMSREHGRRTGSPVINPSWRSNENQSRLSP